MFYVSFKDKNSIRNVYSTKQQSVRTIGAKKNINKSRLDVEKITKMRILLSRIAIEFGQKIIENSRRRRMGFGVHFECVSGYRLLPARVVGKMGLLYRIPFLIFSLTQSH